MGLFQNSKIITKLISVPRQSF